MLLRTLPLLCSLALLAGCPGGDDVDGSTDCLDADCDPDAACDTSLADYDIGSTTGYGIATGSTVGAGSDLTPSCG